MQLQIRTNDPALEAQVEQLLQFYLSGLADSVRGIEVTVDSRRDSLDKPVYRCRVQAATARGGELDIEETQADLVVAITRALTRCARCVQRRARVRGYLRSA